MTALLLAAVVATTTTSTGCPIIDGVEHPAVTMTSIRELAIVPEGSVLLEVAPEEDVLLEVWPIRRAETLAEVARVWRTGQLTCGPRAHVLASAIRSPVDGRRIQEPISIPILGRISGDISPGLAEEARFADLHDMATLKSVKTARLHVRAQATRIAEVTGGAALSVPLLSVGFGVVDEIYGPVVRLGAAGSIEEPTEDLDRFFASRSAAIRTALDDRAGVLEPGMILRGRVSGYGAIHRQVVVPASPLPPVWNPARAIVAHAVAGGLPAISLSFSFFEKNVRCIVLCDEQVIPGDQAYLDGFLRRSPASIRASHDRLIGFEVATFSLAALSVLIPTGRRGLLTRPLEILEDLAVLGESVLVGATTPSFLRARFARAGPITFHEEAFAGRDPQEGLISPLSAGRTARAATLLGSTSTLLIISDAGWGWTLLSSLLLAGTVTGVAYHEVDAGLAFPSDIPLAIVNGLISGGATVMWHQIFWRDWPGQEGGDLPLRLIGLDVQVANGQTGLMLRAVF